MWAVVHKPRHIEHIPRTPEENAEYEKYGAKIAAMAAGVFFIFAGLISLLVGGLWGTVIGVTLIVVSVLAFIGAFLSKDLS
jgi:hypothetical protein